MNPYQYFQYQNINKTLLNYLTLRKNTLYLYHKSIDRIYHEDNNLGMFCLFYLGYNYGYQKIVLFLNFRL